MRLDWKDTIRELGSTPYAGTEGCTEKASFVDQLLLRLDYDGSNLLAVEHLLGMG